LGRSSNFFNSERTIDWLWPLSSETLADQTEAVAATRRALRSVWPQQLRAFRIRPLDQRIRIARASAVMFSTSVASSLSLQISPV